MREENKVASSASFNVPKGWKVKKAKYIASIYRGGSPRPIDEYLCDPGNGFNWIKIGDTTKGYKYITSTKQAIIPEGLSKTRLVHKGDLLLTNSMSFGEAYILDVDGCIHDGWLAFAEIREIEKELLYYYLSSEASTIQFKSKADGGIVLNLNIDKVKDSYICIPPKQYQMKLVPFLDEKCSQVDTLISNVQSQIEKLKAYKQSLITEVVTKGLDPTVPMKDSGVEWIGKIPKDWNVNRLKFCASYNDESLTEKENPDRIIKYVEIGSVTLEDGISHTEQMIFSDAPSRARRITRIGDIIVSTVRTYLKAIASITESDIIVSTGFCVIRPNRLVHSKYLEYFCKSNLFLDSVSCNSYGISYPAINATSLMGLHIITPSLQEQIIIGNYLDEKCAQIDRLIAIKQEKIDKLTQYKKSLIYEYVTGKREVM